MNNNLYEELKKQKELENLIKNYQQPIELFELKKLNKEDEAENIYITNNTIFLGNDRLQIKKLDGTLEKYNLEKYYPIDEKDEKIKELNKKVEELERRLSNEYTESTKSIRELDKSSIDDSGDVKPNSKTSSKSISK